MMDVDVEVEEWIESVEHLDQEYGVDSVRIGTDVDWWGRYQFNVDVKTQTGGRRLLRDGYDVSPRQYDELYERVCRELGRSFSDVESDRTW